MIDITRDRAAWLRLNLIWSTEASNERGAAGHRLAPSSTVSAPQPKRPESIIDVALGLIFSAAAVALPPLALL